MPSSTTPPRAPASGWLFLGVAFAFLLTMLGTTLPTPLYPVYQQRFGFSQLMITVIFTAYAVGVIAALITTGRWSDQVGRRPLLLGGLLYATFTQVPLTRIGQGLKDWRFLAALLLGNFVVIPLVLGGMMNNSVCSICFATVQIVRVCR